MTELAGSLTFITRSCLPPLLLPADQIHHYFNLFVRPADLETWRPGWLAGWLAGWLLLLAVEEEKGASRAWADPGLAP